MAMELFSLRWNDYHTNISHSFHALLETKELMDVTLAVGGHQVKAHRLILSICSPYFRELFKANPCQHPIVILNDVTMTELTLLLQFMYRGEVHVRHSELARLLQTAEMLQVKGLTVSREQGNSASPPPDENPNNPVMVLQDDTEDMPVVDGDVTPVVEPASPPHADTAFSPPQRAKPAPAPERLPLPCPPIADDSPTKREPIDMDTDVSHLVVPECKESSWHPKVGGVKCPSCNRFFANRYNLKVHIRDKHDTKEGTLQCEICQKRMRNPSCLRVHMYHHRKQAAYITQLHGQKPIKGINATGDTKPVKNGGGLPSPADLNNYLHFAQNVVPDSKLWPKISMASPPDLKLCSVYGGAVTAGDNSWNNGATNTTIDSKFNMFGTPNCDDNDQAPSPGDLTNAPVSPPTTSPSDGGTQQLADDLKDADAEADDVKAYHPTNDAKNTP